MRRSMMVIPAVLATLVGPLSTPSHAATTTTVDSAKLLTASRVDVTGTITCTEGNYYDLQLRLEQNSGLSNYVTGWGWNGGTCTGAPQTFKMSVDRDAYSSSSVYRKGQAKAILSGSTYGQGECHYDEYWDYWYCDYTYENIETQVKSVRIR